MNDIAFTSTLRPSDYRRVSALLMVSHPLSIIVMAAGPVLWGVGSLTASRIVVEFGRTMSWLVIGVPIAGILIGWYAAYRPSATEIYEPALWEFSDDGVSVHQHVRDAFAAWDDFERWRRVAGCYLLHTGPQRYVIIPSRDVPADRRADFEALLKRHVG